MHDRGQLEGPGFTDWDEVHEVVADAYFPHALHPLSHDSAARSVLESSSMGALRFARIGFGAAVSIESDHPGAYGINIPLTGSIVSVTDGKEITSTPGMATICPPDTPTVITQWSSSCEIIGFKVDRDYLQREMDRILGRPGQSLPRQLDLREGAGAEWLRLVRSVSDQALSDSILLHSEHVSQHLSGALTTALVLTAMPEDDAGASGIRPRIVKRVIDAVHEDPSRPWTAGDMAEIVGVSVRRMQQGFREYVGMTPIEYLTDVRLARVHTDLIGGDTSSTVSDVAARWGLMHNGRFAAAYRRKYGVSPSRTLRRDEY
ncbi:AraC family transcriptional regulator [Rhodococcoides yunnanense]|uniref:AraC family transcriptional regulator n=1 Tax=Rhodococcoides yunnanense TaxID=278209 RepID=UPI0009324E5C|nr:AraC family transcriptional regulator [Rhodococcus yunnanensis]